MNAADKRKAQKFTHRSGNIFRSQKRRAKGADVQLRPVQKLVAAITCRNSTIGSVANQRRCRSGELELSWIRMQLERAVGQRSLGFQDPTERFRADAPIRLSGDCLTIGTQVY